MIVFGLMMVRNEVDLLQVNLLHHLDLGVDAFLVVDNGSTDGTEHLLEELGRDERVIVMRFEGPYRQAEVTTALAREAYLRGADWIVPIDADEFWWAPEGDLRGALEASSAGALELQVVNFVQRRGQIETDDRALLGMTRRVAQVDGDWERAKMLVAERRIGFVEITYPPKWICRASIALELSMGNHQVRGEVGRKEKSDDIVCLHAPLRSRALLEAKMIDHGRRSVELGSDGDLWWQARRWHDMYGDGGLEAEWRANSYTEDGLDVDGETHPLVVDTRLRDAVEPWIDRPALDAVAVRQRLETAPLRLTVGDSIAAGYGDPVSRGFLEGRLRRQAEAIAHLRRESRLAIAERDEAIAWLQEKLEEANEALAQRDEAIAWLQERLERANERPARRGGLMAWWRRGDDV